MKRLAGTVLRQSKVMPTLKLILARCITLGTVFRGIMPRQFVGTGLAAEQGNADAQYGLGNMYADGIGVRRDFYEAARWYRLAATQGNPYAQNNLGLMYETGTGVREDFAEAFRWYRLAADQGNPEAQYNLNQMILNYHGTWSD